MMDKIDKQLNILNCRIIELEEKVEILYRFLNRNFSISNSKKQNIEGLNHPIDFINKENPKEEGHV